MMAFDVSRRGLMPATGALLLLALTVAGFSDAEVAETAAHAPRSIIAFGTRVSWLGLSGYMLVVSAALAVGAVLIGQRTERLDIAVRSRLLAERAMFFFVAIAGSGIICQIIKHVVGRARPKLLGEFGAFHFDELSWRSSIDSFPSGHSTTVFAAAVALSLLLPSWRGAFIAVALLVCISRILAGAHFPSDVIAGAALGSFVAVRFARSFAARGLVFESGTARLVARTWQTFDPARPRVSS